MRFFTLFSVNLIFLVSLLSGGQVRAESSWGLDFNLKTLSFTQELSAQTNNQLYKGDFDLSYEQKFQNNLKFKFRFQDFADPTNKSDIETNTFDLPEFNIKKSFDNYFLKFGTDIYSWGVTDAVNPVDFLNTRNYFDPIHSRKLGTLSMGLNYSKDIFEVDGVYIPLARSAELPGTQSRWLPREIYVSPLDGLNTELILPKNFNYSYRRLNPSAQALNNNLGLRIQLHLNQLDLAFYAYDGVASIPQISPEASGVLTRVATKQNPTQVIQVQSNVVLRTQEYRVQTGGFSFVKSFSSWQIKGVTAWTQPINQDGIRNPWIHESVLSLEKNWNVWGGSLISILQYSTIRREISDAGNDMSSLGKFFDNNWMLGGKYLWKDTDSVTLFGSYDSITYSSVYDLKYEKKLSDRYRVGFSYTSIEGPVQAPLGLYSKNKFAEANFGMNF